MSSNDVAIRVDNLSKCYLIYEKPADRLKQFILPRLQKLLGITPKQYYKEFWALKDVSFEVKMGETVGILGMNGAGKSTILQIVAGILTATNGSISTKGRVVALLELGAGFNFEFTGRENIFIYGAILGLTFEEIVERFRKVEEFAEIGSFIDLPVKTYSSGMFARLAFSVAINVNPEILIIDETLSVGDARFQQKCIRKINELKEQGCTIFFVSHDVLIIKKICEKALLINSGRSLGYGDVQDMANKYFELLNFQDIDFKTINFQLERPEVNFSDFLDISLMPRVGDQAVNLISGGFFDEHNNRSDRFSPGDTLKLKVLFQANQSVENVFIGFMFKDEKGIDVFGCNSLANMHSYNVKENNCYIYELDFKLPHLINRKYIIDLALSSGSWNEHKHRCWIHDAFILEIFSRDNRYQSHTFVGLPADHIADEKLVKFN